MLYGSDCEIFGKFDFCADLFLVFSLSRESSLNTASRLQKRLSLSLLSRIVGKNPGSVNSDEN